MSVYVNNSTVPFVTVSFSVGGTGGGTGGGGTTVTAPSNSTSFGPSCAASFPGTWNTSNIGIMGIDPVRADGFLTGSSSTVAGGGMIGNGFVIGRVLTAVTNGVEGFTRWLMAPSGQTMVGLPNAFFGPGSASKLATTVASPVVPCLGTGTAALWVGQWDTVPFGTIRARMNLNGSVSFVVPQNCDFPGGTFTGTASGLGLSGTFSGPSTSGTFSLAFPSNDIGNFSGTYTVGSSGTQTWTGKYRSNGLITDFQSSRGFSGRWYTPYGLLTLKVTGTSVVGTYPNGGTITGTITPGNTIGGPDFGQGSTLSGSYSDLTGSGTISLRINANSAPGPGGDPFAQGSAITFYGSSTNSSGFTAPWVGARAGDWSGTWSTQLGTMTASQRGDGKWVFKVGGYTFVGNATNPPAGGNAVSGQFIGPFGGGGFVFSLNPDGVSFSGSVAAWSHLGLYATLQATHVSDTIGPIDLCSTIRPVTTITTVPSSLQVRVDQTTYTAPVTRTWPSGEGHSFATPSPQTQNNINYSFALWNYTLNAGGTILAPPSSTTYTAVFMAGNNGAGPGGFGGIWTSPNGPIRMIPGSNNTVDGIYTAGGPGGYSGFTCTVSGNTCTGTAFTPNGPPGTITITSAGPSITGTITRPGGAGTIPVSGTPSGPSAEAPGPRVTASPAMTTVHQSACTASLPDPLKVAFFTNDANITHWVSVAGVNPGDVIGVTYVGPGGVRYFGQTPTSWSSIWACYTLPVSPANAPLGSWTVSLSVNNQTVAGTTAQFTLSAPPPGQSGIGGIGGGGGTGGGGTGGGGTGGGGTGGGGTGGGGTGGGGTGGTGTPATGPGPDLPPATGGGGGAGGGGTGGGGTGGGGTGAGGGAAGYGLLCNGGFEEPAINVSYEYRATGSTAMRCWTVVAGDVDQARTFFSPSEGAQSLDLNGSTAGTLRQSFATVPGTQYTVSFDLAGNAGGIPAIKRVRVSTTGTPIERSFDITGRTVTNMGWQRESFTFRAESSTTVLEFTSLSEGSFGPAIDNVCAVEGTNPCGGGSGSGGTGGGGGGTGGGASATLTIPASANIYAAGRTAVPALTDGGGTLPPVYNLPVGAAGQAVTVTNVTGTFMGCRDCVTNGPDGSSNFGGTNSDPNADAGQQQTHRLGISGIRHDSTNGFLIGVFTNGQVAAPPPPASVNFTTLTANTSFTPLLFQTFYVGDGLTGTGTGSVQQFIIPAGATQFYLGYVDGFSFSGYPGYFGDNRGQMTATVQLGTPTGGAGGGGTGGGGGGTGGGGTGGGGTGGGGTGGGGGAGGSTDPCASLVISPSGQPVSAAGGSFNFSVSSSCAWTAVSNATWLQVTSGQNGNGNGTVVYLASVNSGAPRTGTITVGGQTFSVFQNGTPSGTTQGCSYPIQSTTTLSFNRDGTNKAGGTSGLVRFLTNLTCAWTVAVVYPPGMGTGWITAAPLAGSGNGAISITVAANTGNARQGSVVIAGQNVAVLQDGVPPGPPVGTPAIATGGVVNAASYAPGGPPNGLAQGSFFSIFGTSLGPTEPAQAGYPLPTNLGGVSVEVLAGGNTYNAYLVFVSAGQINGLLPSNVPAGPAQMTVTLNGRTSAQAAIQVSPTSFGTFFQSLEGNNVAIAQNVASATDYPLNLASSPAKPGQIVILWGTGLGPINGPDNVAPGGNAGDLRAPPRNLAVSVTVGGLPLPPQNVLYAGRQAESSGVDNIYFTLPANVSLGCNVPVQVTVGGVTANTTSIAITADGSPCR